MVNIKNQIKIIPIIPSLNPDNKLLKYVDELIEVGFKKIIIVDDGSGKKYNNIFKNLEKRKECIVLVHSINQGKGRALKTAFNYYLNNISNYDGVVTADSDGQHSAIDTLAVAKSLLDNQKSLILGTRNFNVKNIPFKSFFGNKITSFIFKILFGKLIKDTQTGLRGISNEFVENCLKITGERFEYEINMLIFAVREKIDIKEIIIDTIYIEDNKSSHFNPVVDSFKIYSVMFNEFFKFTVSGIASFLIDISLFTLFLFIIKLFIKDNSLVAITLSTILSRLMSSLFNFYMNKLFVFNSKNKNTMLRYYMLCITQMFLSSICVSLLFYLTKSNESICKVIVDGILFIISFNVQKKYIFRKENN